jgi:hypothetical protein
MKTEIIKTGLREMINIKLMLLLFIALAVGGCTSLSSTGKSSIDKDGKPVKTLVNTKMSQRTIRAKSKHDVGEALCTVQSDNHTKQQSLVTLPPPIIIQDGVVKELSAQYQTTVNNPNALPFNMVGCVEEMMRMPMERLGMLAVSSLKDLLSLGIKGYAGVEIAKRVLDKSGVVGDNNKVYEATGDVNANESLGGIPLNDVDVEPLTIGVPIVEVEDTSL